MNMTAYSSALRIKIVNIENQTFNCVDYCPSSSPLLLTFFLGGGANMYELPNYKHGLEVSFKNAGLWPEIIRFVDIHTVYWHIIWKRIVYFEYYSPVLGKINW